MIATSNCSSVLSFSLFARMVNVSFGVRSINHNIVQSLNKYAAFSFYSGQSVSNSIVPKDSIKEVLEYMDGEHETFEVDGVSYIIARVATKDAVAQGLDTVISGAKSVVADSLSAYDAAVSGDLGGAIHHASDVVTSVGQIVDNLDKPTVTPVGDVGKLQTTAPQTYGTGVNPSVRLGLNPREDSAAPLHMADSLQEMDLRNIARIPGMINITKWSANAGEGTTILAMPVSYLFAYQYTIPNAYGNSFPPLTLCAQRYVRYKGSVVYKFRIIGTHFHKGRLMFAFHPFNQGSGTYTVSKGTAVKNMIFDYSADNSECEFEIPFYWNAPWMNNPNQGHVSIVQSAKNYWNFNSSGVAPDFPGCFGIVTVSIVNQLSITNNVAGDVSIVTWISGGKDIQFDTPFATAPGFKSLWRMETASAKEARAQSGGEETPESDNPTSAALVTSLVQPFKGLFHCDDNEVHLKSLCRRKSLIYRDAYKGGVESTMVMQFMASPLIGYSCQGADNNRTPLQYFPVGHLEYWGCMYALWRGSLDFSMLLACSATDRVLGVAVFHPFSPSDVPVALSSALNFESVARLFTLGANMQNLSITHTLDVNAPYSSTFHYNFTMNLSPSLTFPSDGKFSAFLTSIGEMLFILTSTNTQNITIEINVFNSAGDNFVYSYFLGCPDFWINQDFAVPVTHL